MDYKSENENIEFKKSTGELKESIISLTAMLNKNGEGKLYFGVANNGSIVGQDISEKTLRKISKEIADKIIPKVTPTINEINHQDKKIIEVIVKGKERPYSAYGRYYIRSFDEDRMLEQHELFEMIINNNNKDILTMIESDNQNLNFKILKNMYIERGLNVNEDEFENNLDLFNLDGKYNYMAYLLADSNNISIKVVTFKGNDKTEILRRNEYGNKCLLLAIDQVVSYIESINDINVEITSHKRIDNPLFDMASFREAWMNACLHSRWDRRVPPVVYIYSNRLEIVSIGGLPTDLSIEKFYRGTSRPVNEKLQKIFGQLGFVEQTGHGVPVIVNKYGKETFDIDSDFITVTIPFSRNININNELNDMEILDLNDSQIKTLHYISVNNNASVSEIADYMGVSEIYVKKILSELKKRNYIKRVGSNRQGSWEILK